jgi:hypothetical protein
VKHSVHLRRRPRSSRGQFHHPLWEEAPNYGPERQSDYCQSCRAYLKTYNGEENETLFLADWTSLHLDVMPPIVD